jgi:dTDP-glucose 4,6-dehydratase
MDEMRPHNAPHAQLIRYVADRPGHDRRYAIDHSRLTRELGWKPRHNLGKGLQETVEWYLSHPGWIEAIQRQSDLQTWMKTNYADRSQQSRGGGEM